MALSTLSSIGKSRRQIVVGSRALLAPKVEQAGVVAVVGLAEELGTARGRCLAPSAQRRAAAPYGSMPRSSQMRRKMMRSMVRCTAKVELALRQARVAQGDVAGQHLAPALDLFQEGGVHLGGAALGLVSIRT